MNAMVFSLQTGLSLSSPSSTVERSNWDLKAHKNMVNVFQVIIVRNGLI